VAALLSKNLPGVNAPKLLNITILVGFSDIYAKFHFLSAAQVCSGLVRKTASFWRRQSLIRESILSLFGFFSRQCAQLSQGADFAPSEP